MEVRPGYKQTEVGVIPNDWEPRRIDSVCVLINGRGFKPFEWKTSGLPIIRIQNLNGSDDFNFFDGSYAKKLEIEPGQLLFAWSGSRGTSFGPHIWSGPLGLLNYHTWKINAFESEIDKSFLFHALKQLTTYIEGWAHGASALVHVQKWQMEGFQFPYPPCKQEQEAIAAALSATNGYIESLEKLIAKKRDLQQGAMQELLTGKRRLPSFSRNEGYKQTDIGTIPSDWDVVSLQKCLRRAPKYGINAPATDFDTRYPTYLRITDITEHGKFEHTAKASVAHPMCSSYELEPGDIAVARTGASVGKSYLYNPLDGMLVFAGFLIRLSPNSDCLLPEFLSLYMQSRPYWNWVKENSMRSGQPGINGKEYAALPVPLPPTIGEQAAITEILIDYETQITVLESKLTKILEIKQGMMQELLTGRIRLI
ncbi:restriction endonuclease subunit S [Methylocystis sp. MJC1]|uniref:restriction endonuclease subunit S n=1 Tax=Methylocystis sp. MJC1 TaxID=2654282 RepID=UPI0013EDA691|nr:restriction endonuclease subunit S [Methylocystis sp. MJC1]KAF2990313.1 Type-1 restriction enzyme EcoKI specificity protein [Methylocystis sp. MJC1]MBU6527992.1 restriction endonuclease subunit S [Methylocystis sp. MJC1]UZX10911.1 restriction endonuclease subunit S [Methylocystis sp. MJC1]